MESDDQYGPNVNGTTVAYCFHSVDGFSKFGSYTGTGAAGNLIETGFEPAFVMIKRTDAAQNWPIEFVGANGELRANLTNAETSTRGSRFLSNGFELTSSDWEINASGGTYIYMAFAADPDTEAPTVAKSFSTVTWQGGALGSSYPVTGLGFQPNLVWIKGMGVGHHHYIVDSIRGADKVIASNLTNADPAFTPDEFGSFDSDGFTLTPTSGGGRTAYSADGPYAAWAWKADDNEPTITQTTTDIDAIAIYKFEDNTNDVTGNFNASSTSNITYNASGKFNKSAEFNGSSSTITLPITTSDLGTGSACSISWWWKPNTSGTTIDFLFEANATDVFMIHTGGGAGSQGLRVGVKNTSETAFQLDVTNAYTTGVWQHHVATFGNGKIKLYENGNLIGSLDYNGTIKTISNIAIGNRPSNPYWYSGELDQVRIYNGELDAASITNLYNETTSQNNTLDIGTDENTSIEAVISANANAGFSIVKYEGSGVSGQQVPHGLSAAPEMIFIKNLDDADKWAVYNSSIGATKFLVLNETAVAVTSSAYWNNTAPTSTVFTLGATSPVNSPNNENYIAYCFHSVSGYSKIGSYTGTGSAGLTVTTGFQVDFLMIKGIDSGSDNWFIFDSVRGDGAGLHPNLSIAEFNNTNGYSITFNSTSFTLNFSGTTTQLNTNGNNYIYMAFKIN